jgi:hypothetical protein
MAFAFSNFFYPLNVLPPLVSNHIWAYDFPAFMPCILLGSLLTANVGGVLDSFIGEYGDRVP